MFKFLTEIVKYLGRDNMSTCFSSNRNMFVTSKDLRAEISIHRHLSSFLSPAFINKIIMQKPYFLNQKYSSGCVSALLNQILESQWAKFGSDACKKKNSIKRASECLEIEVPVWLKYSLLELFRSWFSVINFHRYFSVGFYDNSRALWLLLVTCKQIC